MAAERGGARLTFKTVAIVSVQAARRRAAGVFQAVQDPSARHHSGHAGNAGAGARRETLTITGTLHYQACDDTVCYRPVDVPVTWTIKLEPLAR